MKKQLEFIQAIRGIATLLVVYLHTGHSPQFGAFGVDLFFVLSGALMGMLMAQGSSGSDFLWRRIVRIVPLYFLATTAAYTVSCLLPSLRNSGNVPTFTDYLMSIAFIPYEARDGQILPVLGLGWTLNYEMAFYLCCAAACAISPRRRTLLAAGIVIVAGLSAHVLLTGTPVGRFYSNPIILEFAAGLFVWSIFARPRPDGASPLIILPVACLIASMVWLERASIPLIADTGEWSRPLRYLLPALLVVGLAIYGDEGFRRIPFLARRPLTFVGDASYAIYLTHTFVLGALSIILPKMAGISIKQPLGALIAIAASTGTGIVIYLWVETPVLRRLRSLLGRST